MRLATVADVRAILPVYLRSLAALAPADRVVGPATAAAFLDVVRGPGVLVAVDDDVTAFALSERQAPRLWEVRYVMPHDMSPLLGLGFVKFLFVAEHQRRPFPPDAIAYGSFDVGGPGIEDRAHDFYAGALDGTNEDVPDAAGAVRLRRVRVPVANIAQRAGVTL